MQTLYTSHSNSEQCEKLVLAATELNAVMPMSARWKLELSRSCDDWEAQKSPSWSTHAPKACLAFRSKDKHLLLNTKLELALEAY